MEGCLLCLDINKEFVDCIKVDSLQWQEFEIKNLIDKHLWLMDSILPSSWLCCTCWQALYDFHKFYMRIEEAHIDFGKLLKTESKDLENSAKEEHENPENNQLFDSHLEPEILIDQLAIEDYKPIIKEELDEDITDDNIPLLQRQRRARPSKDLSSTNHKETTNEDPLKNAKHSKKSSSKCKNRKKDSCLPSNTTNDAVVKPLFDNITEIETPKMKLDPEHLEMSDKSINTSNTSDSDDVESFSDNDYNPEKISKRPKQTKKKKSQQTKTHSESDDSNNSDNDNKPEDGQRKRPKQTYKEKDQFLADNYKMSCVICHIPMDNFRNLIKHFENEHKERGYALCCNKKFYHRGGLLEHVHCHVDPSNFKCNDCGKVMPSRNRLQAHQLIHLSEEEKKFPCTECGKSYAEQKLLTIHINRVHLRLYVKICDICGKRLRCGEAFQRHMLEHEGKTLPTISCDVCGLLLASKHGLKKHKTMQHPVDGKREYICNICFKVSPNIAALREHKRRTHSADNHKCNMCGRGFKVPLALKEHMATHTGIALYTCTWCPKTFNASGGLHAHRKRQHPIEWEQAQIQKRLDKYKTPAVVEQTNKSDFEHL